MKLVILEIIVERCGFWCVLERKWVIFGWKLMFFGESEDLIWKMEILGQTMNFLEDFWEEVYVVGENVGENWVVWGKFWKDVNFGGF